MRSASRRESAIPVRVDLDEDAAVLGIASRTGLDSFAVVGRLIKVWGWARRQTSNGKVQFATADWIDGFVRHPGFAAAMVAVHWLEVDGEGILIPKFERWLARGQKAKAESDDKPDGNGVICLVFPVVGSEAGWALLESKLVEWQGTYRGVDVKAECQKAWQWCQDNPAKRKTAKGMARFLSTWLSRCQDRSGRFQGSGSLFTPMSEKLEQLKKAREQ